MNGKAYKFISYTRSMNELFRQGTEPIESGVRTRFTDVVVKAGYLQEAPEILRRRDIGRYAIITDSIVARLYGDKLQQLFRDVGLQVELLEFPEGEQSKNLDTVGTLVDQLGAYEYGRNSAIIALGGGVVGDVVGLTAAGYKRGVPYVQFPTTLLAQVDSSLGGKTAVDTSHGKNLFGAFHHPILDLVDPKTTLTLPERVYKSSFGEVVKYGAIDPHFRRELEEGLDALLRKDAELLSKFVLDSLLIKAFYVDKDPFDKGVRQILNFGHTIGHGVEFASDYELLHGESVSIGMSQEGRIAVSRGHWTEKELYSLNNLLQRIGLPTEIPDYLDKQKIMGAIRQDKKKDDRNVKLVVPGQDPLTPIEIKIGEDDLVQLIFRADS